MSVKLVTWNLQGQGDKGQSKVVTFNKLLGSADILCLQECGELFDSLQKKIEWQIAPEDGKTVAVGKTGDFSVYYYYWSERCNLALFFKSEMTKNYQFFLPDKETQRPALGAKYGDVWIFSVHGPGKGCNLKYCQDMLGYINTFASSDSKKWLAAGDFNCDRDDLAKKAWDFKVGFAPSCGHSTHLTAKKEIDLVAYSPGVTVSKGVCVKAGVNKDGCEFSSDHTPMMFEAT
ncbi:MAG TPA: endonuclease/exonuclease/phosphatase family protein [Terriglobales bacterium]|nr:endonuclease/exonuclease/phosphatase family protein [Terriglobales bacterium]